MVDTEPINVLSTAPYPGCVLSNFAFTPFELDGIALASVEGFLQGLKEEKAERQARIFALHGTKAKRASSKRRNRRVRESGVVWWQGSSIAFRSEEYFNLIERAIRAKFNHDESANRALIDSGTRPLVHDTGRIESSRTSLPASRFLAILEEVRSELLAKAKEHGGIKIEKSGEQS